MAIYDSGAIDYVVDNRGRYWIIDPVTRTRYETAGPGSGSHKAAQTLYGSPRNVDTMLSGWNEYPGGAVTFFGGPNEMERVIAGLKPDPFTGYMVPSPQAITTGSGQTYRPPNQMVDRPNPRAPDPTEEPDTGPSQEQQDAFATTQQLLEEYGLEGLTEDVREWINEGFSAVEISQKIRETEAYKTRFAGLALREQNGLAAISPAEYIALERAYRQIMRTAGMPAGYYDDPEDFATFIGNDISAEELEARVADGIIAAQTAPPEVREALSRYYGVENSMSAMAAYYLDPEKGLEAIEREFRAAAIGGAAARTTWGELTREEAEGLEQIGLSGQQAQQGFADLASQKQLMGALPGEVGSEEVTRQEQMDARFRGDAEAMDEIRRQRERRVAAFAGQVAGATASNEGVTGLRGG